MAWVPAKSIVTWRALDLTISWELWAIRASIRPTTEVADSIYNVLLFMKCLYSYSTAPICRAASTVPPSISSHQKRQPQSTSNTQPHNRPPRHDDLLITERCARIPHQMPDPIQTVVRERERKERFRHQLECVRPSSECSGEGGGFEMPAEQRCDEVGGAEEIEGTG